MFMSHLQTTGQNHYIQGQRKKSFENVVKFRHLGTKLIHQNCIHDYIKSRLYSGNDCFHAVLNRLSCLLFAKNVSIEINKSKFYLLLSMGEKLAFSG
jgi:hypothetical protein